ncbi:MAG: hypothetical protein PSV16_06135 [Flavobacterium sp.]|nr:hypothetical protein [Flavobacterium sp.]
MKIKNFLLSGVAGGITDFLLGWVTYGMLFRDYFGGNEPNMAFISLGCLFSGFLFSYVLVNLGNFTTFTSGLKAGAVLGFFIALMTDCFMIASEEAPNFEKYALDVAIMIVTGAVIGGVVAAVNGALSKSVT